MPQYAPPLDDIRFLLSEVFDLDGHLATLTGCAGVSLDDVMMVLGEAGKFCTQVLQPLNASGDLEGCRLRNGKVSTPEGFAEAYRAFVEQGWSGLSGEPAFGGQGLPRVVQILFDEMMCSSNLSFGLFPGLTRGASEAISQHADPGLKETWLPKLISGEWTGAMALTEAAAGSDLGLLSARAEPFGDGSYSIRGTKTFISSGDHDFGGNIVHLVLARLPDAPAGVKGISLFLVPKFRLDEKDEIGPRNAMSVLSLEHKMGIHAQPTCVMNYEGAVGWLVGEPGKGLNAMFTMMNAERLFIGIQGLAIAEASGQRASAYAKERLQGRSPDGARAPVSIIEHPDIRKMLLGGMAFREAARALAVWAAMQMDAAARHVEPVVRQEAEGLVALMTPVIKALFTDFGFETAVQSQQVFGGHGYIRETGMEQFVRDARIAQIYEGTNGIQALDLVVRKLAMEGGKLPHRFFSLVNQDLTKAVQFSDLTPVAQPVLEALARLEKTTSQLQSSQGDSTALGAAAADYLRFFGLVCLGWMWVRMAHASLGSETVSRPERKLRLARFFVSRMLPQSLGLDAAIGGGADPLMELPVEDF